MEHVILEVIEKLLRHCGIKRKVHTIAPFEFFSESFVVSFRNHDTVHCLNVTKSS